jgi:RNA ligase (TIGR02306 family)
MSTFKVESRKISETKIHPNADRLSLCKVEGLAYQFVTGRDQYKVGDTVVFFPLDAELPIPLIEALGMVGKFSGPLKNRISTVKLRGEFSQGFVCPIQTIFEYLKTNVGKIEESMFTEVTYLNVDFTSLLGITKYEPEPVLCKSGNLVKLPENVPVYDIEGCDRYDHIVKHIIENKIPVYISEKLEGTNFSCTVFKNGEISVNQRHHAIKEIPDKGEHDFWKVAREQGIIELAKNILNDANADEVTLRGEMLGSGIQKNLYKINGHQVKFFDLMINGKYANPDVFLAYMDKFNATSMVVPTIALNVYLDEWLAGRTIQEACSDKSALGLELREGVVIKPMVEGYHPDIGRLILKQRDKAYLEKTGL